MQISKTLRIAAFACAAFAATPSSAASLLEAIFGSAPRQPVVSSRDFQPPMPPAPLSSRPMPVLTPALGGAPVASQKKVQPSGPASTPGGVRTGGGGSLAVCVRTCDGFFFPINYEGARGTDRFADACQASCPGAETEVYFKPPAADISHAANARGRNYTQLPNAFRYRQGLDNTCSCKGSNETWAQALKGAEEIIGTRKTDIVVTPEKSQQSIRPTAPATPATASKAKDKLAAIDGIAPKVQ